MASHPNKLNTFMVCDSSTPIDINTGAYFSYLEWVAYNIYGLNKVEYNNLYWEKNFTAVPPLALVPL